MRQRRRNSTHHLPPLKVRGGAYIKFYTESRNGIRHRFSHLCFGRFLSARFTSICETRGFFLFYLWMALLKFGMRIGTHPGVGVRGACVIRTALKIVGKMLGHSSTALFFRPFLGPCFNRIRKSPGFFLVHCRMHLFKFGMRVGAHPPVNVRCPEPLFSSL